MDKLRFDFAPALAAQPGVQLGHGAVSDNHGNVMSERQITCANGVSVHLGREDWSALNSMVRTHMLGAGPLGREVDLGGTESPLNTYCRLREPQGGTPRSPRQ